MDKTQPIPSALRVIRLEGTLAAAEQYIKCLEDLLENVEQLGNVDWKVVNHTSESQRLWLCRKAKARETNVPAGPSLADGMKPPDHRRSSDV